jgi:dTDP-glucose pyrophosphorylase
MDISSYTIDGDVPFGVALSELDRRATQILLVVDSDNVLRGTITDGDMRRAILRKMPMESPVSMLMNPTPVTATPDCSERRAKELMAERRVHHLPIIDAQGRLKGIFTENELIGTDTLDLRAVLMVGGLGQRLGELTRECPKPLLKIGGKPILQTIVEQLCSSGVRDIYMAVNYLGTKIKEFFGDGGAFGVNITYLEEDKPLGTAGALRLLELTGDQPLLVMNGDILTKVNYARLLRFHNESLASATMCVREYVFNVPYGVVIVEESEITGIEEKPASHFFINSGIYILDPSVLHYVPNDGPFTMPELFDVLREQHKKTVAYPVHEYWMDVGNPDDFKSAGDHYESVFQN